MSLWETFVFTADYGGLAWLGYHSLWTVSLRHGAKTAIGAVKRTNRVADGTPLIRRYTGIARLDENLVSAVIFYNGLLDSTNTVHRLLLVDIHSTMQATALCMLASSR